MNPSLSGFLRSRLGVLRVGAPPGFCLSLAGFWDLVPFRFLLAGPAVVRPSSLLEEGLDRPVRAEDRGEDESLPDFFSSRPRVSERPVLASDKPVGETV